MSNFFYKEARKNLNTKIINVSNRDLYQKEDDNKLIEKGNKTKEQKQTCLPNFPVRFKLDYKTQ